MEATPRVVALLLLCLSFACGGAPTAAPATTPVPGQDDSAPPQAALDGLSTMVPANVSLFAELRHVEKSVDAWLPEQDGLLRAGEHFATLLGVSPRTLTELFRSVEAVGVTLHDIAGGAPLAVLLRVGRNGPLEQLLADAPFEAAGSGPHGGERYLLNDAFLERLGISRDEVSTATYFAEHSLLVVGAIPVADAIAEVLAGRAPALASSSAYVEASASFVAEGVNAYLDVASLIPQDDREGQGLLDAVLAQRTPVVATMRVEPDQRLTIHAGLSGTAMPDARLYAAPPALELARLLPIETVAYQAYSSRFGLRGKELARALQSLFGGMSPDTSAMVRQLEGALGLSFAELLDGLGDQGVLGVVAPRKLRLDERPIDQLAYVWVQQLRPGASGRALLRAVAAKIKSIPHRHGMHLKVERQGDHVIVAAGDAALMERSLEAFVSNKATLRGHKSHARSLRSLQGSQLLTWVDTQRVVRMLTEAFPNAGRELAMLQRDADPERVSGAMAFSWRLDQDLWRLRLDMLDASTVGMIAALSIHGVRRYLAASKAAEAKATVGAIARAAQAAYEREQVGGGHALCKSASPVPAQIPAGKKYMPRQTADDDWNSGDESSGWRCLRFAVPVPHRYRYRYVAGGGYIGPQHGLPDPGPKGFEVIAEGDLDGDGVTSLFLRQGQVDPQSGALVVSRQLLVVQEFE